MAAGEKRDASMMFDSLMGLFHVPRAKEPLVSCPRAGCGCQHVSLGSFGSRLIRSNNHSNATLWVRKTCLIVGLTIILITASLSSMRTRCAAGLAFGGTRIDLLYDLPFRRETFLSCSTSGEILTRSARQVSPNGATHLFRIESPS